MLLLKTKCDTCRLSDWKTSWIFMTEKEPLRDGRAVRPAEGLRAFLLFTDAATFVLAGVVEIVCCQRHAVLGAT